MIQKFVLLAFALAASVSIAGETFIGESNFVDLNVPSNSLTLGLPYPGGVGGCGLQIRFSFLGSSEKFAKQLTEAITVDTNDPSFGLSVLRPEIRTTGLLTYRFPKTLLGAFKTWVHIKTNSGKTLAEVIGTIVGAAPPQSVGAIVNGISCE